MAGSIASLVAVCAVTISAQPLGPPTPPESWSYGGDPLGSLLAFDGALYGTTSIGPDDDHVGTIFKINTDGSGFAILYSFKAAGQGGRFPTGQLVAADGWLYGTTSAGGLHDLGTIFRIKPDGSGFSWLHSFSGGASDGAYPRQLLALSGVLYGMTFRGGTKNLGTIFKINFDGSGLAVLHSFVGGASDGQIPTGSLIASDGVLYGITPSGGRWVGYGTIFKIRANGRGFELLRSFSGCPPEGGGPLGSLVEAGGVLYGMTSGGIAFTDCVASGGLEFSSGALFRINRDGSGFAVLRSLDPKRGECGVPTGSLVALEGTFFGMTVGSIMTCSDDHDEAIFAIKPDGRGYERLRSLSTGGTYGAYGAHPGSLIALGGVLYGVTMKGGNWHHGTVFKMSADGSGFTVLHSFAGYAPRLR